MGHPAERQPGDRARPPDQRQQRRHVGAMVTAGQRAAEWQEQCLALAPVDALSAFVRPCQGSADQSSARPPRPPGRVSRPRPSALRGRSAPRSPATSRRHPRPAPDWGGPHPRRRRPCRRADDPPPRRTAAGGCPCADLRQLRLVETAGARPKRAKSNPSSSGAMSAIGSTGSLVPIRREARAPPAARCRYPGKVIDAERTQALDNLPSAPVSSAAWAKRGGVAPIAWNICNCSAVLETWSSPRTTC